MKRIALISLAAAVPVELVNFFVFMVPLDVGIQDNATWYTKLLGIQWVLLHFPGLHLTSLMAPHSNFIAADIFIWFLSGYIDTALVIFACVSAMRWLRRFIDERTKQTM